MKQSISGAPSAECLFASAARDLTASAKNPNSIVVLNSVSAEIKVSAEKGFSDLTLTETWFYANLRQHTEQAIQDALDVLETLGYKVLTEGNSVRIRWDESPSKAISFIDRYQARKVKRRTADSESELDSGAFRERVVYGFDEKTGETCAVNPFIQSNALYVGGMGSGKSTAMRDTLTTRLASNSEHDLHILIDPIKGMADYEVFSRYPENCVSFSDDPNKLPALIGMVYAEFRARVEALHEAKANDLPEYERKTGKKIARVFAWIEELQWFYSAHAKESVHSPVEPELGELMRWGRKHGIFVMAASQRGTNEGIPNTVKASFQVKMGFRLNNPGDALSLGLPEAANIMMSQRGRCATETGFRQFGFRTDEEIKILLDERVKPLTAVLLSGRVSDYQELSKR